MTKITPEILIRAYACGVFPMAESRADPAFYWVEPEHRGVLPLDRVHVPRRLARTIRQDKFEVRVNTQFPQVMESCAESAPNRDATWINGPIIQLFCQLHEMGFAHSVEVWHGEKLEGGLYGVSLGAAFFGESMFSRSRDASKVALVHLVARLRRGGFRLLDTQFVTSHLERFGVVELDKTDFHNLLATALRSQGDFDALPPDTAGSQIMEIVTAKDREKDRAND